MMRSRLSKRGSRLLFPFALVACVACDDREAPKRAAASAAPSASAPPTTEIHATGFRAKLPGTWREDPNAPDLGGPETHGYARIDGAGEFTTSRYPMKAGLSPAERRLVAERMLDVRSKAISKLAPSAKSAPPQIEEQQRVVVARLTADGPDIAVRFFLHVADDAAVGIFYYEQGARAEGVDARFEAIRSSFEFVHVD
jgi:hypothetical protein